MLSISMMNLTTIFFKGYFSFIDHELNLIFFIEKTRKYIIFFNIKKYDGVNFLLMVYKCCVWKLELVKENVPGLQRYNLWNQ